MPDFDQTILLAGGGTGGHLYPGISVAEVLRERLSGAKLIFLCTQREIDRAILEPTGFPFIEQPIVPPASNVGGLLKFWKSWRETKDLLRKVRHEHKPAFVLGLGGYAAGVAVKVASQKGIPTAILNPDVVPGKANQYLMRHVRAVCCQFEATRAKVSPASQGKIQVTGCPIRRDIRNLPPRAQAIRKLGLDPLLKTLVVTGASQGALTVNEAMTTVAPTLELNGWQILHLAGKDHAASVRAGYRDSNVPAAVVDFTPAMADVWAVADLTISRAGASSCAELTACGIPSVLMPYPFHKDNHQRLNALVLQEAGASILVDDARDKSRNAQALKPVIESLLHDSDRRARMAQAARGLGKPGAAEAVADVVTNLIQSGR